MAKSVKTIQALVRGFLVRTRIKNSNRKNFEEMRKSSYSLDELGWQITRLNGFYNPKLDATPLVDLGKAIIAQKTQVLEKCCSDVAWVLRVRIFLRNAFGALANNSNAPHAICIRILEVRMRDD